MVHYSELQKSCLEESLSGSSIAPWLVEAVSLVAWLPEAFFLPIARMNVNFPAGIALFGFAVKTELTILVMLLKNICHVKKSCCL